jgi:hypothetical protein
MDVSVSLAMKISGRKLSVPVPNLSMACKKLLAKTRAIELRGATTTSCNCIKATGETVRDGKADDEEAVAGSLDCSRWTQWFVNVSAELLTCASSATAIPMPTCVGGGRASTLACVAGCSTERK